jgi:hypothetical protein
MFKRDFEIKDVVIKVIPETPTCTGGEVYDVTVQIQQTEFVVTLQREFDPTTEQMVWYDPSWTSAHASMRECLEASFDYEQDYAAHCAREMLDEDHQDLVNL